MAGLPIPADLFPPAVYSGYASWLDAFWELCSTRQLSTERIGAIPVSAILTYAQYLNLSDLDTERFKVIIRRLDGIFMRHESGQNLTSTTFDRSMLRGLR